MGVSGFLVLTTQNIRLVRQLDYYNGLCLEDSEILEAIRWAERRFNTASRVVKVA